MEASYKITIHRLHHYERGLDVLERAISRYMKKDPYKSLMSVSMARRNGHLVIEATGRQFALEARISDLVAHKFLQLYAGPVTIEKFEEKKQERRQFTNVWGGPY
ncbi:hypothetical protein HYU09_04605 [Candidatus Woesearchaeota archaeon]|nr:hypothetical protein [Candidatus Woesearchaeota archaeon]